jgi:hypothetical protein
LIALAAGGGLWVGLICWGEPDPRFENQRVDPVPKALSLRKQRVFL